MKILSNLFKKRAEKDLEIITESIFNLKENALIFWNKTQKMPILKRRRVRKLYKQVYALKGEKENGIN